MMSPGWKTQTVVPCWVPTMNHTLCLTGISIFTNSEIKTRLFSYLEQMQKTPFVDDFPLSL